MPLKFKPSQTIRDKSGKTRTEHFYMKSTLMSDLTEALENKNTHPKRRQKIRNELFKRSIKE
jgi:hypothetical protein|tara:strand:+ start:1405 stop:1590 length:186 start_codon:yes stop_codon:yes gene_type:complete